jgi:hypothetical protein
MRIQSYMAGICVMFLSCTGISAQEPDPLWGIPDTLVAVKRTCEGLKGSRIQILENKNSDNLFRENLLSGPLQVGYSYVNLYSASASAKIKLIEELLSFGSDTAIACLYVEPYTTSMVDSFPFISSKRYTIQLDALYHINFICFGPYAPGYAPFPVLYDKVDRKEVNGDPAKIREVYAIYRRWFENCKARGFKNYYFPLLGSRYEWRFGSAEKTLMKGFPDVQGDILHWLGRPKPRNMD